MDIGDNMYRCLINTKEKACLSNKIKRKKEQATQRGLSAWSPAETPNYVHVFPSR
jgi:hypothetical protein